MIEKSIPFTQYLLPNGERRAVSINRPDPVIEKAKAIMEAGFRFECEMLSTGYVSFTVSDDYQDYDIRICLNGPEVPQTVDELILHFNLEENEKVRALHTQEG